MSRRCLVYFEDKQRLAVSEMMEGMTDGAVVATVGWGEGVGSGWGITDGAGLMTGGRRVAGETTLEMVGEIFEHWNML